MRILFLTLVLLVAPAAFANGRQVFSLSVTPKAISAPVGGSIAIKFTVTNRSHQSRYIYRDTFEFVHLSITDAQGSMLLGGVPPPPPPEKPILANLVLLAPGQSFSRVKHFDLAEPPTNEVGAYAFYFIVAVPSYPQGKVSSGAIDYYFSRDNVVHVTVKQK